MAGDNLGLMFWVMWQLLCARAETRKGREGRICGHSCGVLAQMASSTTDRYLH